ncbi:efflux RND transporter periplasmic adaptor subunit [Novosphingobium sp. SG720]|uniref:efflux RND transporter periplasmic adaptor subunit n=1 Tax=Novosphingobium TaxID=165696 RepID=UPI001446E2B5|nr:efflux RND transporter periplasmic adaptor subunit [Novosphingobium sp. SG720]NKJ41319.1 membrane fusion protein (multidrug efflux system) [Novosphingobium sp. SG720]
MAPLALATLSLAALSLGGCGSKQDGPPPQDAVVGYIVATPTAVPVSTELSGRTVASQIAEVRPQVTGIIMDRLFTEGSMVRAGQPLYQIDARSYAATANQAAGNLAATRATVESLRLKAERYKVLADQGGISRQDAADALASYNQARGQVMAYEGALQAARVSLGFTRILAPISGRIGVSSVTKGALVTSSQTDALAKIQKLDPMWVNIQQSSNDYMALRRALQSGKLSADGSAPVKVILADGTEWPVEGRLNFADVDVNSETGTVILRVTVPNPKGDLLPGLFVKAQLVQGIVPNGILVPQAAVSRTPRGTATVLVVNAKGEAETRDVTAETPVGTNWLVTSGLKAGDKVITEGLIKAKPGAKVKASPAGSAPAAAANTADAGGAK